MSAKDIRDRNVISCRAKFIMLVEKYVVLSRLAEDEFHKKYECIIITGRGQLDVLTQRLLRKLSIEYKLPVLVLMDYNPSGYLVTDMDLETASTMSLTVSPLTLGG
jgi:DNA topoisomerase VI subunit A